jgi:hypothetical protein
MKSHRFRKTIDVRGYLPRQISRLGQKIKCEIVSGVKRKSCKIEAMTTERVMHMIHLNLKLPGEGRTQGMQ